MVLKKKGLKIVLALLAVVLLATPVVYINHYYHAQDVDQYLHSQNEIIISQGVYGYYFDAPESEELLVFYPGAKVEYTAYSELMLKLAQQGIDCYLVKMPANLALFGMNRVDDIMEAFPHEHNYLAGHSLGGAIAAKYASENSDKLDGLIFLAAYSAYEIDNTSLAVLSIYGSEDGVLNRDKVIAGRDKISGEYQEVVIEGGNHSQYASYGFQKGDNAAKITYQQQLDETVSTIVAFMDQK